MTSIPSAGTWSSPIATKHALLIHGITASSHTWHNAATALAAQGYFVTAPNIIGHGLRTSTDYSVDAIAQDLRPYVEARNHSLIIGHALGALAVLALSTYISLSYPTAIVLVDPPLNVSQELISSYDDFFFYTFAHPRQAEGHSTENPLWKHEDCTFRELATRLCTLDAVLSVFRQNNPWYFFDYLNPARISNMWKVTALVADPEIVLICPMEDFHPYPHVRRVVVPGAGHWIHNDFPGVVVEEALKTVAELNIA